MEHCNPQHFPRPSLAEKKEKKVYLCLISYNVWIRCFVYTKCIRQNINTLNIRDCLDLNLRPHVPSGFNIQQSLFVDKYNYDSVFFTKYREISRPYLTYFLAVSRSGGKVIFPLSPGHKNPRVKERQRRSRAPGTADCHTLSRAHFLCEEPDRYYQQLLVALCHSTRKRLFLLFFRHFMG